MCTEITTTNNNWYPVCEYDSLLNTKPRSENTILSDRACQAAKKTWIEKHYKTLNILGAYSVPMGGLVGVIGLSSMLKAGVVAGGVITTGVGGFLLLVGCIALIVGVIVYYRSKQGDYLMLVLDCDEMMQNSWGYKWNETLFKYNCDNDESDMWLASNNSNYNLGHYQCLLVNKTENCERDSEKKVGYAFICLNENRIKTILKLKEKLRVRVILMTYGLYDKKDLKSIYTECGLTPYAVYNRVDIDGVDRHIYENFSSKESLIKKICDQNEKIVKAILVDNNKNENHQSFATEVSDGKFVFLHIPPTKVGGQQLAKTFGVNKE